MFRLTASTLLSTSGLHAAPCTSALDPQTATAYAKYIDGMRPQMEVPLNPDNLPEAEPGGVPHVWNLHASQPNGVLDAHEGVIIHWAGAVRIRVANTEALSRTLARYDMYSRWYQPYMAECRATSTGKGQYRVVTILHDAEKASVLLPTFHFAFELESVAAFQYIGNTANPTLLVTNRAVRIRESESGKPEKADSRNRDNDLMKDDYARGVLWRSDTQWRAILSRGSVYAEYHSISLARSVDAISLASPCAVLKLPGIRQKALEAMTGRPRKLVTTILHQTREACEKR